MHYFIILLVNQGWALDRERDPVHGVIAILICGS